MQDKILAYLAVMTRKSLHFLKKAHSLPHASFGALFAVPYSGIFFPAFCKMEQKTPWILGTLTSVSPDRYILIPA